MRQRLSFGADVQTRRPSDKRIEIDLLVVLAVRCSVLLVVGKNYFWVRLNHPGWHQTLFIHLRFANPGSPKRGSSGCYRIAFVIIHSL